MNGYAQNLDGARAAFARYQSLAGPADLNPLDSLGEVYFYNGDFAHAEKQFVAAREWLKAAEARLMTGDLAGADAFFEQYMAPQPQRELERAQWEFLSGRRKQAMARVRKLIALPGDPGAIAGAQLSFWSLQTSDRTTAARLATTAAERATTPAARNLAAICRFLSMTTAGIAAREYQCASLDSESAVCRGDSVLESLLGEKQSGGCSSPHPAGLGLCGNR